MVNASEARKADTVCNVTAKQNTPLSPINYDELITLYAVVSKYSKLLVRSKIPTLAMKLASKAFLDLR